MKRSNCAEEQLRAAVSDYLEILDERIAWVTAQISEAVALDDELRIRALRAELVDLDGLYQCTESSGDWASEYRFRSEYAS